VERSTGCWRASIRIRPRRAKGESEEIRDACLQRCLEELARQDRDLVVTYYVGAGRERIDGRVRLATSLGVSDNALRLRVQRLRDRLRGCAARCVEQAGEGQDGGPTWTGGSRHYGTEG
jgi:hypothetical protein